MRRWLPFPLLWLMLLALWLLLNQTLWIGHVVLGGVLAMWLCLAFSRLQAPPGASRTRADALRRARLAASFAGRVAIDILRSNLAVAQIILHPGSRRRRSGFLEIPLSLRDPAGLAVLGCIITATPGTAWTRYEAGSGVLTLHILDLVDEAAWIDTIKGRYESRLLEIFQ
jgi:multicomponent K+:H+ antiporter subunit E